jgi:hypothetical protein
MVEADIADNRVGHPATHKRFFKEPAQRIASVEDGEIAPAFPLRVMPNDFTRDLCGLVFSAAEADDFKRYAVAFPCEQGFAETMVVSPDDTVCGGQNVSGATEVFLEADLRRTRKVLRKAANVFDVRAAPAEDRLIIVTDREDFLMPGAE